MKSMQKDREIIIRHDQLEPLALQGLALHAVQASLAQMPGCMAELEDQRWPRSHQQDQIAVAQHLQQALELLTRLKMLPLAKALAESICTLSSAICEFEGTGHAIAIDMNMQLVPDELQRCRDAERQKLDAYVKANLKRKAA